MLRNKIDEIRFLFCKGREFYSCLYHILGFHPHDIRLYEQALLHKSTTVCSEKERPLNDRRLEFLDDAILDTIVGDIVYQHFRDKREGFLTNTRSKMVQREALNKLAVKVDLDKLIKYSTRSSSHDSYMYGNTLEAFIEAIYLDRRYECYEQLMQKKIIEPYIDLDKLSHKEVNFKSKLVEWSQRNKMEVSFELIEQFLDRENNPVFQMEIRVESMLKGSGTGCSRKESQQNAAQMALEKIKGDPEFMADVQEAKVQNNISTGGTPDDPEINQIEESPQVDKIASTESISI